MNENNRPWIIAAVAAIVLVCLCCLCVAGGGYVFYVSQPPTETPTLWPSPTREFSLDVTPTPEPPVSSDLTIHDPAPEGALEAMRLLEEQLVPESDPVALAERLGGQTNVPRVLAESAVPLSVGAKKQFYVSNVNTDVTATVTATLRYASDHVYFWVANGISANEGSIRRLGDLFENKIYPTDREFFGSEWTPGIDGDVHLYILYTPGMGDSVAGYFSTTDEYSPLVNQYSNGHEMFYLNSDTVTLEEAFATNVLAHEFQHMIHWSLDRNEEAWINEGASELAVLLNGFEPDAADYYYLSDTDMQLTNWPSSGDTDTIPWYGGSFLFMTYFLDRFGSDATQALVRHKANGMDSVDAVLREIAAKDFQAGGPLTGDMLFSEFAAALMLDDTSAGDGRFAFSSFSPSRDPKSKKVTVCPSGVQSGDVSQYGIDYLAITCAGDYRLAFSGQTVQTVLPVNPPEGKYYAWSNRGDESDMTLTRTFDLPAGGVTLQYQIWHDIEENWDYAYLEVSTDNGQTWNQIQTPSGTSIDPQGNNYGWGWTGLSGGGSEAEWTDEEVDLSAYAGKQVLIRFEYVTDAAVNGEGLIVDNIRIPEMNYSEGFEVGLGGWETAGFFRLENQLPQTFQVLVIRTGGTPTVERLTLDARNYGDLALSLSAGETAYLIVIGTTPHTFQKAEYQFEILR